MGAEDKDVSRRRRGPVLWIGLVAVVAAGVVAALIWSGRSDEGRPPGQRATTTTQPGEATSSPPAASVEELSGTGDRTSDTFTVAANWEIRWKSAPSKPFAIELLGKDGASRGEVVQAGDRTDGTTFVSEAGGFKLKVTASGEWSIRVFGRS